MPCENQAHGGNSTDAISRNSGGLMSSVKTRVMAVVVTYLPVVSTLEILLKSLLKQVDEILVVDNTPARDDRVYEAVANFLEMSAMRLRCVRLGQNMGVATALNVGIEAAVYGGFDYVLLSDQDSAPAPGMVEGLLRAGTELSMSGVHVGAVGPTFTDIHTGITFPFQAEVRGNVFYGHVRASVEAPLVEALTLITSGTLIPVAAFSVAGMMREDLFIDQVDIEWCHRARAQGLRLYGTSYATMSHHMGDAHLRVWYFGWRRESAYSPVRLYYRIRNFIVLCKAPHVSARWKMRNAWYSLGVVYSHLIFGNERWRSLKSVLRGLCDGARGKLGPM
jgi:rhamnosyltransferase